MGMATKISWCQATFNPWLGCTKVSPACANCYAERDMDHRFGRVSWGPAGTRVKTADANWKKPLSWDREAGEKGIRYRVFCASLADVFERWDGPILDSSHQVLENVTMDTLRCNLFYLIDQTPNLDWLLLTKRPENIESMWRPNVSVFERVVPGQMVSSVSAHRPNVWLGVSCEDDAHAQKRIPYLHKAKQDGLVSTTFISAEPLLGDLMLCGTFDVTGKDGKVGSVVANHLGVGGNGIDWVIAGGESGDNARPLNIEFVRSIRNQCVLAGIPFHFKQWGEFDANGNRVGKVAAGRVLDGVVHDEFPCVGVRSWYS